MTYLQWKYRIEGFEKWACVSGVHGEAAAVTSTYECFVNEKGCRNTNKPGDLMVCRSQVFGDDCETINLKPNLDEISSFVIALRPQYFEQRLHRTQII